MKGTAARGEANPGSQAARQGDTERRDDTHKAGDQEQEPEPQSSEQCHEQNEVWRALES